MKNVSNTATCEQCEPALLVLSVRCLSATCTVTIRMYTAVRLVRSTRDFHQPSDLLISAMIIQSVVSPLLVSQFSSVEVFSVAHRNYSKYVVNINKYLQHSLQQFLKQWMKQIKRLILVTEIK